MHAFSYVGGGHERQLTSQLVDKFIVARDIFSLIYFIEYFAVFQYLAVYKFCLRLICILYSV